MRGLFATIPLALFTLLSSESALAALSEADQACRIAQNKNMQKAIRLTAKAMAKCHRSRNLGKIDAATNCNDFTMLPEKFQAAPRKLIEKMKSGLAGCTEEDGTPVASSALHVTCPAPCDDNGIRDPMASLGDIADCLECVVKEGTGSAFDDMFGLPDPAGLSKTAARCHKTLLKGYTKFVQGSLKEKGACQVQANATPAASGDPSACEAQPLGKGSLLLTKAGAGLEKSCLDEDVAALNVCNATSVSGLRACADTQSASHASWLFTNTFANQAPGGSGTCVDDNRVVAYIKNWSTCPSPQQMAQYSHAVIAFAVNYQWTPSGVICDASCTLGPVPGCVGKSLSELVGELHAAGVDVTVSVGGALMGGLWNGCPSASCWEHCFDKVPHLASQLTALVSDNGLDGIDIDYEYCTNTPDQTTFLTSLTNELRAQLDATFPLDRKTISHVPMESEVEAGDPYFEVLQNTTAAVDYVMIQYYNGFRDPFSVNGLQAVKSHYGDLVNLYGGDASRVVMGHCIEPGCAPVATHPEALTVAQQFATWYPDNGGVFFWGHDDDDAAWFSQPYRNWYDANVCGP